jgi:hypothetical protein
MNPAELIGIGFCIWVGLLIAVSFTVKDADQREKGMIDFRRRRQEQ